MAGGALGGEWQWDEEAFEFDLTPADWTMSLVLCDSDKVGRGAGAPRPPGGGGGARLAFAELPIKEIMFGGPCEKWCVPPAPPAAASGPCRLPPRPMALISERSTGP